MPEVQQPIGTPVTWEDEENQIKDKVRFCGRQSCRQDSFSLNLKHQLILFTKAHTTYSSLSPQQRRVSLSLAKLNIPSWYSGRQQSVKNNKRWRREKESGRSWKRRSGMQSCTVSRPITPDSISLSGTTPPHYLPGSRSNYRWSYHGKENTDPISPSPAPDISSIKSINSFLSYKEPYLGWRSQERLKLSSSYLHSPSQRLSSSLLNTHNLSRVRE